MFSSRASQSHSPLGVRFTNMKFHTFTSPPCLSYAPLKLSSSGFIASQHPAVFIPSKPQIFLPSKLSWKDPQAQFSIEITLPFCHSKSCTLIFPRQTWAWVAQFHLLCLWRWFALEEANMSSKPLWELPFRLCPASSEINTETSLTPDGPGLGTLPEHDSPARHLIHYTSVSPSFRRTGLLLPSKVSNLYLPLLATEIAQKKGEPHHF